MAPADCQARQHNDGTHTAHKRALVWFSYPQNQPDPMQLRNKLKETRKPNPTAFRSNARTSTGLRFPLRYSRRTEQRSAPDRAPCQRTLPWLCPHPSGLPCPLPAQRQREQLLPPLFRCPRAEARTSHRTGARPEPAWGARRQRDPPRLPPRQRARAPFTLKLGILPTAAGAL